MSDLAYKIEDFQNSSQKLLFFKDFAIAPLKTILKVGKFLKKVTFLKTFN